MTPFALLFLHEESLPSWALGAAARGAGQCKRG
jgi:hypothetical protein